MSNVTGISVVKACTEEDQATPELNVLGVLLTRCTTDLAVPPTSPTSCTPIVAEGPNDAVKCWVNARISITPDGTNRVGTAHTFFCTVEVDNGTGTFVPPPAGTQCEVTIQSGPGTITGSPCTLPDTAPPAGVDADTCDVTGNSAITGLTQVRACTDVVVQGVTINDLCTAPIAPAPTTANCDTTPTPTPAGTDALKCWVNARIRLTPNDSNPVNTDHIFFCTIQVEVAPNTFIAPPAGTQCNVTEVVPGPGTISGTPCTLPDTPPPAGVGADTCDVLDTSPNVGLDHLRACTTFTYLGVTFTDLCTVTPANPPTTADCPGTGPGVPFSENPFGVDAFKCWFQTPPGECFVIWDEEALDNDFRKVERAARALGTSPGNLINDNQPKEKTDSGDWNEWVLDWVIRREATQFAVGSAEFNDRFVARIQTGQDMDEGWFVLPPEIVYGDGRTALDIFPGAADLAAASKLWAEALVNGTLEQNQLDKILDVQPLRNYDLQSLEGKTCTALVWDSDISMNYKFEFGGGLHRIANMQGAKLGVITFTILDVVMPQATSPNGTAKIPESTSSTSFFDVIIQIEPREFVAQGVPVNQVQQTDTVAITRARCRNGTLTVLAETNNPDAELFIAVEGPGTPPVPALITEHPPTKMMTETSPGKWQHIVNGGLNCLGLRNKVVTVYSDNNGDPLPVDPFSNDGSAFGSGGTYNARISN